MSDDLPAPDVPDEKYARGLQIVRARLRMASEPEVVARLIADADDFHEAGRALAQHLGDISPEDAAQLVDARFRMLVREEVEVSKSEQRALEDYLKGRGYPLDAA